MTDISSLSPDERKRFYAELRQDEEYKKNKMTMIKITGMAVVALLFVMLMIMRDLMPMWLVLLDLILIVLFYMYFAYRTVRRQSQITDRFAYYWGKDPRLRSKGREKKDRAKARREGAQ